ncbi:hypothetical protein TNIN_381671 [Trichonephila inaurata madagascariensis]|uniref:Uncharacterized protein n=1 Tax=Trichonephila inaurata madagascariensis TaxID=2747483 RepID=A0A8X7CI50_9ARAC|nr:hypothetical protein TNIN_381671 [Trichonephila inaurata madagascariensis]
MRLRYKLGFNESIAKENDGERERLRVKNRKENDKFYVISGAGWVCPINSKFVSVKITFQVLHYFEKGVGRIAFLGILWDNPGKSTPGTLPNTIPLRHIQNTRSSTCSMSEHRGKRGRMKSRCYFSSPGKYIAHVEENEATTREAISTH